MATILCIDDDCYLTDLLRYALMREGFEVLIAHTGREALRLQQAENLSLAVLDVDLPDMDGFNVLSALRTFTQLPVIILSTRARDEDVIAGFLHGADDYVAKPFSVQVLINRIKAVLRRVMPRQDQVPRTDARTYRMAAAVFDANVNELVGMDDTRIKLTPTESRILHLLCVHEGQVLSSGQIFELVWGYGSKSDTNVIKTHIRHLREKIGCLPGMSEVIATLPARGYVIRQAAAESAPDTVTYLAATAS